MVRGLTPGVGGVRDLLALGSATVGLAWSPDGARLAAVPGGKSAVLWHPGSGGQLPLVTGRAFPLGPVQWTGDGRYLTALHRNWLNQYRSANGFSEASVVGMTLWDAESVAELRSWTRTAKSAGDARGDLGAAGDRDTGEFEPCRGIALAPAGSLVARVWWRRAPEIWELSGL